MTNLRLENTLDHNLKPLKAEDKILPLNVSEGKVVYPKHLQMLMSWQIKSM